MTPLEYTLVIGGVIAVLNMVGVDGPALQQIADGLFKLLLLGQ